jgi:TonB family protein
MGLPREFALIARHFRPLAGDGALDLSDDAALLTPPEGQQLVLAADALVEGVHFLPDDPPGMIARKLLRVNLSDLAAMGAAPLGYLMTTAFTRGTPDAWIADFVAGLAEDQQRFGLQVLGGDTVATPGPACFSLTIIGVVPPGQALHRRGARIGDEIWVSGSIGDAALGLRVLQGKLPADADVELAMADETRMTVRAGRSRFTLPTLPVADFPDIEAEFPGGYEEWKKYLLKEMKYPEIAIENGDQGTVYVMFIIETDGSIGDVKVTKGVSFEVDREARRVIKSSPKWIPGRINKVNVRSRLNIPIKFNIY